MIHQVSIKSLPQEWLWCETWCDDASKKYAKTIDLVSIFYNKFYSIFSILSLKTLHNNEANFYNTISVIIR